jgi:hypothetical protein
VYDGKAGLEPALFQRESVVSKTWMTGSGISTQDPKRIESASELDSWPSRSTGLETPVEEVWAARGETCRAALLLSQQGAVAQLGERLICIQEAVGSIPISSTRLRNGPVAQLVRAHP